MLTALYRAYMAGLTSLSPQRVLSVLVVLCAGLVGFPNSASADAVTTTIPVGTYPVGVEFAPSGQFAYVTNYTDGTVSRIATATASVTHTIPVGSGGPYDVNFTPSGTSAYVANLDGNLQQIDTSTNAVVDTVSVGGGLVALAMAPSGSFFYVTNYSGGFARVETASNTISATVALASNPLGARISPDGTFAYIAQSGANTVTRIDTGTNAATGTTTVGTNPSGVAFAPDGKAAYVTNYGDSTVSKINTLTNAVTATIPVGANPAAISVAPNGKYLYVSDAAGNVFKIDLSTNAVVQTLSVSPTTQDLAIDPTGTIAYVTSESDGTVAKIVLTPAPPLAPTVVVHGGSATATVQSGFGATPTSYIVSAKPGGKSCQFNLPATSCKIAGLRSGRTYRFTATATNAGGTSPPSPPSTATTPRAAQKPLRGCVTAPPTPKGVPRKGTVRLERPRCVSNAGQRVHVAVSCPRRTRGDLPYCRVFTRPDRSTWLRTYGYRVKLRITWSAPGTKAYAPYRLVRKYRA